MGKTWGSSLGMAGDQGVGLFEGLDEAQGNVLASLCQAVVHGLFDILEGALPRDDWLLLHLRLRGEAARLRRAAK